MRDVRLVGGFGGSGVVVDPGRGVVFAVAAGYFGGPVAGLMTNDDADFEDPASESVAAQGSAGGGIGGLGGGRPRGTGGD